MHQDTWGQLITRTFCYCASEKCYSGRFYFFQFTCSCFSATGVRNLWLKHMDLENGMVAML